MPPLFPHLSPVYLYPIYGLHIYFARTRPFLPFTDSHQAGCLTHTQLASQYLAQRVDFSSFPFNPQSSIPVAAGTMGDENGCAGETQHA